MIVAKFGVRKFISGWDVAYVEMRTASQLYNALVAVEQWKRAGYSVIRSRYVPGLSEIEEAYEQISDWIGEHAGKLGERGKIREKRQKATAETGIPTKRVDVDDELETISEMKRWRRDASEVAKPLRAIFLGIIGPSEAEYDRRTAEAPAGDNWAKKRINASAREAMLEEPEWSPAWKDIARLEATAYELRSWIGDAHSLNHGTYIAVSDDVIRAGKRPPPRPDSEPRKPRKRPGFSRRALKKLGWQLQGTVTWGDVCAGKNRDVQITEIRSVGGSGRRWRATVRIRVSTPDRARSEWVAVEIAMHRPIPDDTLVKWIYLVPEERPGGKWEYSAQFTLVPTKPLIQRAVGTGLVKIDLCWTQHDDTLIVARINGEPLELPRGTPKNPGIVRRLRTAEHSRKVVDGYFNEARDAIVARLEGLPIHVREMCSTIEQWRSPKRLERVVRTLVATLPAGVTQEAWNAWRKSRLGGKRDLHAPFVEYLEWREEYTFVLWLDCWRRKQIHLERMADGTRRHAANRRRDFYRATAARLAERFEFYELGGAVDLAALALRDKSEDSPRELHQAARHNRTLAAVSELKAALAAAFGPERERFSDSDLPEGARDTQNKGDPLSTGAIY
jgi:hypothetical protein